MEELDEIFPQIINELGYNKKEANLDWLEPLLNMFSNTGFLFQTLFYLAVLGLLIALLYRIFSFFENNSSLQLKKNSAQSIGHIEESIDILKEINICKESGNFTLGVIFLYHGAVEVIKSKEFLQKNRDYTNREIIRILEKTKFHDSFIEISTIAQGILFNNETISKEDFYNLEELYKGDYL